jgi:PAS domain S-box-containing protein
MPRSLYCLPLVRQGTLAGLLYLENTTASHVFTPKRSALLELLASQAAISLENTRLYRDLQEREAKVRRLVDSNIIGIYICDLSGAILEANDAFLQILGRSREELSAGLLRWTDLTPPEWRQHGESVREELKKSGTAHPFEKEYYRKDGSRVPVLMGVAAFGQDQDQGVAFVLDLTEQKRAEREARESEQRNRELQLVLTHANRVSTMGQLSASIAHEVKQPTAAAATQASAALRWLAARPPNLDEARESLARIVADCGRAGQIIDRTRTFFRKAPQTNEDLDINEAILEVIGFMRGEANRYGVGVETQFAADRPRVHGDRVQLQQVILNLMINAVEAMSGMSDGPRQLLISTVPVGSEEIRIAVQDSGPGLAPASLQTIFDAFYTTKPSGLGMGLPICRSIIEAHGGRLWVSANVPKGAIFQFVLPRSAECAGLASSNVP